MNNRSLDTLKIDVETSVEIASHFSGDVVMVSESRLRDAETIKRLQSVCYKGFLIGMSFMEVDLPRNALAKLLGGLAK